jgi:hypothetical protein
MIPSSLFRSVCVFNEPSFSLADLLWVTNPRLAGASLFENSNQRSPWRTHGFISNFTFVQSRVSHDGTSHVPVIAFGECNLSMFDVIVRETTKTKAEQDKR